MFRANGKPSLFEEITGLSKVKALLIAVPALFLIAASIWIAVHFLHPMPPRKILMAAGPEGSALHQLGMRYAASLERQGISVELSPSRGTAHNLELLGEPDGEVIAGFIIAGTASPEQAQQLVNVSSLAYVPLWCLARSVSGDIKLAELKGKRLAVGASGSGLNAWLAPLLAANAITAENTMLFHLTAEESVRELAADRLDAVFLADATPVPHILAALEVPGVRLMNFSRADAYGRRFPHIVTLQLPSGTIDLARGIPDRPLSLIGTSLMLAARTDVHPTVVDLLVDAARDTHSRQSLFEKRGEFPHLHAVDDVPVSEQAEVYMRDGPSLLRRYLPLWAADAIQRVFILALPLLAVALPIIRYLPGLLDLLGRRHIFRAYARLRRIDRAVRARRPEEPVDDLLHELDYIEEDLAGVKESVLKAGELYTLRLHLGVVRKAVMQRSGAAPKPAVAAANKRGEAAY